MRPFIVILLVISSIGIAFTQAAETILGSWEIIAVESPVGDKLTGTQESWVGARLHFLTENIIIETNNTTLSAPISYKPQIRYGNLTLEVVPTNDSNLQLVAIDLNQHQEITLKLEPCTPLGAELEQKSLEFPNGKSSIGLDYGGLYYIYDLTDSTYQYFRFFPDDGVLTYKSEVAPEEFAKMIRPFALRRSPILLTGVLENGKGQTAVLYQGEVELLLEDNPRIRYTDYQFKSSPTTGKIALLKLRHFDNRGVYETTEEVPLEFYAEAHLPYQVNLPEARQRTSYIGIPMGSSPEINTPPDESPRFPGCENKRKSERRNTCAQQELLMFIYKNIRYPKEARTSAIQGTTVVSFMVQADGSISDIKLTRDIGGGCGEESLRVVGLMHYQNIRWIPAQQNNQAVSSSINLPITFRLE